MLYSVKIWSGEKQTEYLRRSNFRDLLNDAFFEWRGEGVMLLLTMKSVRAHTRGSMFFLPPPCGWSRFWALGGSLKVSSYSVKSAKITKIGKNSNKTVFFICFELISKKVHVTKLSLGENSLFFARRRRNFSLFRVSTTKFVDERFTLTQVVSTRSQMLCVVSAK